MNIRATERHFSFLASCVTGYDVRVKITDDPSYVGYTMMPNNHKADIVLSYTTSLWEGLAEPVIIMMMLGVLAHECMHLRYTNFNACNCRAIVLARKAEKDAFLEINNIVEDVACEFAASRTVGGKMLKALNSVIKYTWKKAPNIEDDIPEEEAETYAYSQVIRALIQVGDRGMMKGRFLTDTARDAFYQILPLFNAAAVETDGEERVEYSVKIFKILLPLIRKEAENAKNSMPKSNKPSMPSGMGDGEDVPGEDAQSTSNQSGNPSNAQTKQKMREELEQAASSTTSTKPTTEGVQNASEGSQCEQGKDAGHPNEARQELSERPYEASCREENDLSGCDECMEFTDEDCDELLNDISLVETQISIQESIETSLITKAQDDLMLDSQDVLNEKAHNPDEERYNRIVSIYQPQISSLTTELRKIFTGDRSRVKNSNHGPRINTKRLIDGKLHSNILLSRTMPKDLDDMAVYLLIDKSGSMSRLSKKGKRNDQCAAETAICLYEALRALRIPVYITGFTTRGSKALHMHYVTWNSPSSDRYTLANFAADDANYDFYSIAEASKILQKHPAKHKILFVLSDGAPCNPQRGMHRMTGVEATAAAVVNARKVTDVLGVALNCFDESVYSAMYGKDYITVSTANDMFLPIAETLKKIVKSW